MLCQIRRRMFPDFPETEEEHAVTAIMMRAANHELTQSNSAKQANLRVTTRSVSIFTFLPSPFRSFSLSFSLSLLPPSLLMFATNLQ